MRGYNKAEWWFERVRVYSERRRDNERRVVEAEVALLWMERREVARGRGGGETRRRGDRSTRVRWMPRGYMEYEER